MNGDNPSGKRTGKEEEREEEEEKQKKTKEDKETQGKGRYTE